MENKKVIFRRVRGRIIPIRVKEDVKNAALISGGLITAAYAGRKAATAVVKSAHAENISRGFMASAKQMSFPGFSGPNLFESAKLGALRSAIQMKSASQKFFKSRNAILAIGAGAGAAIASRGVKDEDTKKFIVAASPIVAATTYYASLGAPKFKSLKLAFTKARELAKLIK